MTLAKKYNDVGTKNAPVANTGFKCLESKICM